MGYDDASLRSGSPALCSSRMSTDISLGSLQLPRGIIIQRSWVLFLTSGDLFLLQLSVPQSFYLQNGHSDPLDCVPFKISEGNKDRLPS